MKITKLLVHISKISFYPSFTLITFQTGFPVETQYAKRVEGASFF